VAEPSDISMPAISRHLRVLEAISLIVREREGTASPLSAQRGRPRVCD
jgi:DNA-binding transcriptional ArsR family regulator